MKKIFYLMRHGETIFNMRNKIQGHCDSPLTKLGIEQAKTASKYFQDIQIDFAYSSTSERACDTMELVIGNKPYYRLKGLKEMNFGIFEGESEDLKPPRKEYETFFAKYGGESESSLKERIVKTCIEIMEKDNHNSVLAVSHSVTCKNFLSNWCNINHYIPNGIPNCTIFKFEYENRSFKIIDIIFPL